MKTVENVITVVTESGKTSGVETLKLDEGFVTGVVVYYNSNSNQGTVRLRLTDGQGNEIAKMQNIENFRSRNVEYAKDGKPLFIKGGQTIKAQVQSTDTFSQNAEIDVIFIFDTNQTPNY